MIIFSFIIALLLTIVPFPAWADMFRPEWVARTLTYWCMALPQRVGVGSGWFMGLLLDVVTGSLLGQHALGLSVIAFLALKLHQRMRIFPMWQQALTVLLFIALYRLLLLWVNGIIGQPVQAWPYWLPLLTSTAIWPLMFTTLRSVRRNFRVV